MDEFRRTKNGLNMTIKDIGKFGIMICHFLIYLVKCLYVRRKPHVILEN